MNRTEAAFLLGLDEKTATAKDAVSAWKRKAMVAHPDAGGSAALFDLLTEAKETFAGKQRGRDIPAPKPAPAPSTPPPGYFTPPQPTPLFDPPLPEPEFAEEPLAPAEEWLAEEPIEEFVASQQVGFLTRFVRTAVKLARRLTVTGPVALVVFVLCIGLAWGGRSTKGLAGALAGDVLVGPHAGVLLGVPLLLSVAAVVGAAALASWCHRTWMQVGVSALATVTILAVVFGWVWGLLPLLLVTVAPLVYGFFRFRSATNDE